MSPTGGLWAPTALRLLRTAISRGTRAIRNNLSTPLQTRPISTGARTARRVPRPRAFNTTRQSSWVHSLRRYITSDSGVPRIDRSKLPRSDVADRVARQSRRAPFASTLRPNLTGGVLPRTAGGYSLGGGAGVRYFSHMPTAPAQVVNNVSQAMRAFCFSGQRARFDGVDKMGNTVYRAVSLDEEKRKEAVRPIKVDAPGSFVDFRLSPTVTAISPLSSETTDPTTLNATGLIDDLAMDFARAWKDMSAVYADIKRLSSLGDLPITLTGQNTLRIRFPGVDISSLHHLCSDLGITHGILGEDASFTKAPDISMSLKFPFAPTTNGSLLSSRGSLFSSNKSISGLFFHDDLDENPWASSVEEPFEHVESHYALGSLDDSSGIDQEFGDVYRFLDLLEEEESADRF